MPDMTEPSTGPILVADDEEETLELLRTILCHAGYSVRTASCAQGARQEIERNSFALILTDLRLPAASGLDLLNFAREKSPLTVGIIISGHGTVSSAIEALRDGAYDFLLKPCPSEVLLAAVRRALEHHALKSALVKKAEELAVLESQLKDSSRILQDVSHELKNPLSVVCGYAAMLMQRQADSCRSQPETERNGIPARRKVLPISGTGHCPQYASQAPVSKDAWYARNASRWASRVGDPSA